MTTASLLCDGCGQAASPEHIARRLQRLEWTTRFRPVHIGTLLLGAVAPESDSDFLYSPAGAWRGEARILLEVAAVSADGKSPEATLAEFQRGGFFLAHILECPLNGTGEDVQALLAKRLPAVLTRIRRSLKPKRVAPISQDLQRFSSTLTSAEAGCSILLDGDKPFALDGIDAKQAAVRLHDLATTQRSGAPGR
jgi:hypothetical protein